MEKILYVTDAIKLNTRCLDFGVFVCNLTHSRLTGVFLENKEQEARSRQEIIETAVGNTLPGASASALKDHYCEENIRHFRNACETGGVNCTIHKDNGVPLAEVITESRYADLIVIDVTTSFASVREPTPTSFVKEVLQEAECPVVIAPERFDGVDEIIFTYDGSRSSVFAIKQFIHLFPQLGDKKVTILSVTHPGGKVKGDKYKLKEWLGSHYDHIELVTLEDGNVRARLLEYLLVKEKVFVVMGAYGRGVLSNLLAPSHAGTVVQLLTQPVFIAHY